MRATVMMIGLGAMALFGLSACNKAPGGQAASSSATAPAGPPAPLTASSLPQRKPGLWSQKIAMEGVAFAMPASQVCLDAASDARISMIGAQAGRKACASSQITRNLDGSWTVASTCDFGAGGKVVSNGKITGDFNSSYQVEIASTTTGAAFARANGDHKMTITATYLGPCPAGWTGGDMSVNGRHVNVLKGVAAPADAGG